MVDSSEQGEVEPFAHRGRVQAQGGGTEEAVPWGRQTPPTVSDGHHLLDQLAKKLSPSELREREQAFAEAHQFIDRAANAGGVGFTKKLFPRKPRKGGIRVDIEVQKGRAFIPGPPAPDPGAER